MRGGRASLCSFKFILTLPQRTERVLSKPQRPGSKSTNKRFLTYKKIECNICKNICKKKKQSEIKRYWPSKEIRYKNKARSQMTIENTAFDFFNTKNYNFIHAYTLFCTIKAQKYKQLQFYNLRLDVTNMPFYTGNDVMKKYKNNKRDDNTKNISFLFQITNEDICLNNTSYVVFS